MNKKIQQENNKIFKKTFNTKRRIFAIGNALTECRYWHEVSYEEGDNYLTKKNVLKNRLGFRWQDCEYIAEFIEEMFSWSYHYHTYEGSMTDVVSSNWYHDKSLQDILVTFVEKPWLAVSEPKYVHNNYLDHYEWEDDQFINPDGLLNYLKATNDHGLDLEEVSKIFAIGEYEYLRDEEDEQVEAS